MALNHWMAMRAHWASDQIAKLAAGAESESDKLRALRSILADVISVSKFSERARERSRSGQKSGVQVNCVE
jgi:hypothetical protein